MAKALRSKNRQAVMNIYGLPSPIGGWNARDSYDLMAPTDALTMDNWIARENYVEFRQGFEKKITIATAVETLFSYEVAQNKKLLAASNGEILELNLSTGGYSSLASGYSSNQWQYVLYKERIFAVNGTDTPFVFNGTTVGATGFSGSGLTLTNLINCVQFNNRLFFIEKDTLKFWHTDTAGAVSGTLLSYDLSQFSKLGGEIIAIDTWGQNDNQLVLITSEGEVFIYSGTDPADANNWYLRGIYIIPKPIGYRSTHQFAGDLIVITQNGYFNLSRILPAETSNTAVAFSDKISGAVKELKNRFSSFGWQVKLYSKGNYLLINVPYSNNIFHQHIMNTVTGSWSRFTGQNAYCFETFNDNLYFGGKSGNVYQADTGTSDDGANIETYIQQAYNNFETPKIKKWNEILPLISSNLNLALNVYFGVDFETAKLVSVGTADTSGGGFWDTSDWDITDWGDSSNMLQKRIILVANSGYKGSIGLKISAKTNDAKWYSTNIIFEQGIGLK